MRFFFNRKRKARQGVEKAKKERQASEERLAYAQYHVIGPLRELRRELAAKNHIAERLDTLIQENRHEGRG